MDSGVVRTFYIGAAGILGLIFGSFASAVAYRVPRGEAIATGRSKCPNCGHTIAAFENIPVFSWLFLKGRCRHCGNKISVRYPFIELVTLLLFVGAAARFGLAPETFIYGGFFWALVVLTVIDLEHRLLPNKIVYPLVISTYLGLFLADVSSGGSVDFSGAFALGGALLLAVAAVMTWPSPEPVSDDAEERPPHPLRELLLGVVAVAAWLLLLIMSALQGPVRGIAGAVIGGALFSLLLFGVALIGGAVSGRTAMGGGDIKLALGLGAVLGYLEAPGAVMVGVFLSFVSGGLLSIVILVVSRDRKQQIPFGPFLALGTALAVFAGQRLLGAYLGTF